MFKKLFTIKKLEQKNQELKKLNDMRADIISINAHQLRTSLTAMKWVFKMLIDGDLGKLEPEQKEYIGKISERNERMIKLVSEMLAVNKKEEVNLEYSFKAEDIVSLIENVIFDFSGEAFKNNIEINFEKPAEKIPPVRIDTEKIRVVLQNILENAIKYSDGEGKVLISMIPQKDYVEISITDNGIGISPEDQKKIFDKYFRAKNAEAKGPTGTGIGLFTTKNIIDKHGGKIWFESEENKSTTFHFTIPIA